MRTANKSNIKGFIKKYNLGDMTPKAVIGIVNAQTIQDAKKFLVTGEERDKEPKANWIRYQWGWRNKRIEHCFVCNKSIFFNESEPDMIASDAIYFETNGNYGSTVLDLEKHKVRIIICDDCFKERKNRSYVEEVHTIERVYKRHSYSEYRKLQKHEYEANKKFNTGFHVEGYWT